MNTKKETILYNYHSAKKIFFTKNSKRCFLFEKLVPEAFVLHLNTRKTIILDKDSKFIIFQNIH